MPKFKDKITGTIIEFVDDYDVSQMRVHPEYEEIKDKPVEKETQTLTLPKKDK